VSDRPAPREGSIICEDGFSVPPIAGEPKFPPKCGVIADPAINLNAKLLEIRNSYKSGPNYFVPIKVDGIN